MPNNRINLVKDVISAEQKNLLENELQRDVDEFYKYSEQAVATFLMEKNQEVLAKSKPEEIKEVWKKYVVEKLELQNIGGYPTSNSIQNLKVSIQTTNNPKLKALVNLYYMKGLDDVCDLMLIDVDLEKLKEAIKAGLGNTEAVTVDKIDSGYGSKDTEAELDELQATIINSTNPNEDPHNSNELDDNQNGLEVVTEQLDFTKPTGINVPYNGATMNLVHKGSFNQGEDKGYIFQYKFGTNDWSQNIPEASEAGTYTIERRIVKKDDPNQEYKGDNYPSTRTITSKITKSTTVVDNPDGGDVTNVTDPTTGGEDDSKRTESDRIVHIAYDTIGENDYGDDNRSKREKRIQDRAMKKADKKKAKLERKFKRKQENGKIDSDINLYKSPNGDMILENNNNTSAGGKLDPKWKKGAKLLDKIQDFENQTHTSQQEKVRKKTISKELFDTILGKADLGKEFKKVNFLRDFKTLFQDETLFEGKNKNEKFSDSDINRKNIKDVEHKRKLKKLVNTLTVGEIQTLQQYLSNITEYREIVNLAREKTLKENNKEINADNVLNWWFDRDVSGTNMVKVKEKNLGGSVSASGSEIMKLAEAGGLCNVELTDDGKWKIIDGPKTKKFIKTMLTNGFLSKKEKSYKYDQIKQIFFDGDNLDLSKCTLANLAQFGNENPEMKGIYAEYLDKQTSIQELSDIMAGNSFTLRSDYKATLEYTSMLEEHTKARLYMDKFLNGDSKLKYDQLGTSEQQSMRTRLYQFGCAMDSILSYFSAVKIKDFQAKLTANKNNMTYEQFMKAQEFLNDPKKFVEKNVEKKLQMTGFWNEFVNINSSTDTDGQSNKIFAMLMQAAFDFGFGCELVGFKFQAKTALNGKKVKNQNMYDGKGLKTLDRSMSGGVKMTLWPGLNITPKFSVGVGFSNDRISGIERNFAQAAESFNKNKIIEELTGAIDLSTQKTGEAIGKALSTKFEGLADKDEFLKNNKGNIKAFFENDFAKVLTPEILQKLNANTEDKQQDLNWLLTRSISAFLLSLKANAMGELDQKTKMEGFGWSLSFDITKPETLLKIFTLGFHVNFRSYMMKRCVDADKLNYMDEELLQGPVNMKPLILRGSLDDISRDLKNEIGLANLEVGHETIGKKEYMVISAKENGKLHEYINLWDNGGTNRFYKDGKFYIGKDVSLQIVKQRYIDVQGIHLFVMDSTKPESKPGVANSKQKETGIPIKEDYNTEQTDLEGLSENNTPTFTKRELGEKFTQLDVGDIRNNIQGNITDNNGRLLYNNQDLKGKTLQITKDNPLKVEVVDDVDSNNNNIDIKIIDPNKEAVEENISGFESIFTRPTRETIGFPDNMDILQNEEWDGHFKYLKIQMSKLSSPGHRNLYDEYLSNINAGEYQKAITNLQTGIDHILSTDFTGATNQKNLPDHYKLENGRRAAYTLEKVLFTNLQTALQNTDNTVDTQVLVDLVTEKLAYEPLIHDAKNGANSVAWLRKMRTENRKQYYTKVDGYDATNLSYEETRKKLEPNFQNSNLNNILDGNKHIKMEDGDPGLYVTCNYHRGVAPVYGQTFGNKIYGGKDNGSLTFTPGSDQEKAAGKFLSKERKTEGNDIFYKKQVELIAQKIDPNWNADDLIQKIPIDSGGNLFFDEDGNKRESLTFTVGDIDYTINLEKSEVRFCLVGTCANETFAFIPGEISAIKKSKKGKETNFSYEGTTVKGYALNIAEGGSGVTAQVGNETVDMNLGVSVDIDLTKPEKTPNTDGEEEPGTTGNGEEEKTTEEEKEKAETITENTKYEQGPEVTVTDPESPSGVDNTNQGRKKQPSGVDNTNQGRKR